MRQPIGTTLIALTIAAAACTGKDDSADGGSVRVVPPESLAQRQQPTPPADSVSAATPPVTSADTSTKPKPKPEQQTPTQTPVTTPPITETKPPPVQAPEADIVLKKAATAYANLRSLRAEFAQSLENPLLGKVMQSHGTIAQRRPDRFLMRFADPAGDLIVSDGSFFWVYYPSVDKKQVFKSEAATAGGLDLQAQFIGDPTRRFNYTYHGRENVGGRPADVLTLIPKESAGYKSLKVWLDRADGLARKFDLTDETGVVRHIELSNLEINPSLGDALFRFTPPADARIIER